MNTQEYNIIRLNSMMLSSDENIKVEAFKKMLKLAKESKMILYIILTIVYKMI